MGYTYICGVNFLPGQGKRKSYGICHVYGLRCFALFNYINT